MAAVGGTPLLAVPTSPRARRAPEAPARSARSAPRSPAAPRSSTSTPTPIHNRSVFTLAGARPPACRVRSRRQRAARSRRSTCASRRRAPADRRDRRAARSSSPIRAHRDARATWRSRSPSSSLARAAGLPLRRAREQRRAPRACLLPRRRLRGAGARGWRAGELVPGPRPGRPHPSAGAVLVTARPPLAAFNVELAGADARGRPRDRRGAARVRRRPARRPGDRDRARRRPAPDLDQRPRSRRDAARGGRRVRSARLAAARGAAPVAAELVGLVPAAALDDYPDDVPIRGFDPAPSTIEARLARR